MRFVDTYWEKENLGVDSGKFIVDSDEDVIELEKALRNCNKEYLEADVIPGCIKSIIALENNGFHFMETAIGLKACVTDIKIPKSMERFIGKVSYDESTEEELKIILDIISSGKMFLTDKISLNSVFGSEKAGNRYYNWFQSLLKNGAKCFSIHYMGKFVGFELSILKDATVEFFLGGGFPGVYAGAGMMTVTASYDYWTHQSIKSIETNVSSNNLPVLKLHELFGLRINEMRYIFAKNIDN